MLNRIIACLCLLFFAFPALAQLHSGLTGDVVPLEDALTPIAPGSIVIVSELHGYDPHQKNQHEVVQWLSDHGHRVDSALEFLQRRFQSEVNDYLAGDWDESEFLKSIEWGTTPFNLYRPLMHSPHALGGFVWAINADRRITSKVSRLGLDALSEIERAQLPADFQLGNANYFHRFTEAMQHHVPASEIEKYFAAQSIWDETMSSEIQARQAERPERTIVVIVGDFHNAYGGGLPDRLWARGAKNVVTISQIAKSEKTWDQLMNEVKPHPTWGSRADWVWVSP